MFSNACTFTRKSCWLHSTGLFPSSKSVLSLRNSFGQPCQACQYLFCHLSLFQHWFQPIFFYTDSIFFLQGLLISSIYALAWQLSGTWLAGLLSVAFYIFNKSVPPEFFQYWLCFQCTIFHLQRGHHTCVLCDSPERKLCAAFLLAAAGHSHSFPETGWSSPGNKMHCSSRLDFCVLRSLSL